MPKLRASAGVLRKFALSGSQTSSEDQAQQQRTEHPGADHGYRSHYGPFSYVSASNEAEVIVVGNSCHHLCR